ncbi:MAG: YwaF family protein [Clostridia bacterium]|nr:YwaF family protein [Clostridia bacterium]
MFFAREGTFAPCGMFTTTHIIAMVVCLILIVVLVFISRDMTTETLKKLSGIMAIIFTAMETVKIAFHLFNGYYKIDQWFPLSFCGLFIYALWLGGYGRGKAAEAAKSYIEGAAFFAGLAFLVIPATSLMKYPIFHFQCLYSLMFHSGMIYLSIMYMKLGVVKHDLRHFGYFCGFFGVLASVALVMNIIFGSNIMLIMEPYNVPFGFFYTIREFSVVAYILFVSFGYTFVNYWATAPIVFIVRRISEIMTETEDEECKIVR